MPIRHQGFSERGVAPEHTPVPTLDRSLLEAYSSAGRSEPRASAPHAPRVSRAPEAEPFRNPRASVARGGSKEKYAKMFGQQGVPPHIEGMSQMKQALLDAWAGDTNDPHNPHAHLPASVFSSLEDLTANPSASSQDFQGVLQTLSQHAQAQAAHAHMADVIGHLNGLVDPKMVALYQSLRASGQIDDMTMLNDLVGMAKKSLSEKSSAAQETPYQRNELEDMRSQYGAAKSALQKAQEQGMGDDPKLADQFSKLQAAPDQILQQMHQVEGGLPGAPGAPGATPPQGAPAGGQQPPPAQEGGNPAPGGMSTSGQPTGPIATHPGTGATYPEGSVLFSPSTGKKFISKGGQIMPFPQQ